VDRSRLDRILADVGTVVCCYPDMWGTLVGRRMPTEVFARAAERGLSMPNATLAWNIAGEIEGTPFTSAETGFPNLHVQPDLATLRSAPWEPGSAICIMDVLTADGEPHPVSTRGILRRAASSLSDLGYDAWIASELEFYLLTEDGEPIDHDHRCWSLTQGAAVEPVIGEIRSSLLGAGVPVESSQTEGGFGQMEINIGPADPLENADNAAILKYVTKVVARRHGMRATFMPVPFQGADGSGHHLHVSLRATGETENLFAGRPDLLQAFLAGVLDHAAESTAVYLPTINAYKRLVDYTYAPNRVSWGEDNRTVAVRIPAGEDASRRLEIRMPSADANPYLVAAMAIASGSDGLERSIAPPAAVVGDAYREDALERFPTTLADAVDGLESSTFCKQVLGEGFVETFSLTCRRESAAFATSVTEWERTRYLDHA
jgi:glutamine synthetase